MKRARLRAMALLVFGAMGTSDARAAPPADARARAAESYREAQSAFARREYAAAAAAFETAAAVLPHPASLLSAADAWERAGDPARAAEDCDRTRSLSNLGEASATDHVDYAADASACLARVRSRVALFDVRGDGFAVRIDEGPEQRLPLRQWLHSGHHVIVVRDLAATSSEPRKLEFDALRGQERSLDVTAPAVAPATPSEPPPATPPAPPAIPLVPPPPIPNHVPTQAPSTQARRQVPVESWVAFGVAASATVAWSVMAALTLKTRNDFDANPTQASANTFYRDRALAYGAFGTAAVAAGIGLVFWLASSARKTARSGSLPPVVVYF